MATTQRDNRVRTREGPEHASLFQAEADRAFAARLKDSSRRAEAGGVEFSVAHPVAVFLDVVSAIPHLLDRRMDIERREYGVQLARLEVRAALVRPLLMEVSGGSVDHLRGGRDVLIRMVAIDETDALTNFFWSSVKGLLVDA